MNLPVINASFFAAAKNSIISLMVITSGALLTWGVVKSALSDGIHFEPITIPGNFSDKGYSSEITTKKLLDGLHRINKTATTTKARKSLSGSAPGETLSKMEGLPIPAGIDVRAILAMIKEIVGIQEKTISGEIVVVGDPKDLKYLVTIRENPGNRVLINKEFEGQPEEVIFQSAIKLTEIFDPVVAASYFRGKKNIPEALRLIDAALGNDNPADDTFALSQRAQIYIDKKNYELAKIDLDALLKIDPESPQGLGVMSWWYNDQKDFVSGLKYAELQLKYGPELFHGYYNKADALIGLNQDPSDVYMQGLLKKPNRAFGYIDPYEYFMKTGKAEIATKILFDGVTKLPNSDELALTYGKEMLKQNKLEIATHYISKAADLNPKNMAAKDLLAKVGQGK